MNWEELYNLLSQQADDEGKMPPEMDAKAVVHIGDDLTEVRLVQDLGSGQLLLVPVFKD